MLGSFQKYKKTEKLKIKDLLEWSSPIAILNNHADEIITEVDNSGLLYHSSYKLNNGWKLEIPKWMPLFLDEQLFNTLIFCLSIDITPNMERAKVFWYDSYYTINNLAGLWITLSGLIGKKLKSPYGLTFKMQPIKYVHKKILAINRGSIIPPGKSFKSEDFFTKELEFSTEQEFRFVFLEYSNRSQTEYNSLNIDELLIEDLSISKYFWYR